MKFFKRNKSVEAATGESAVPEAGGTPASAPIIDLVEGYSAADFARMREEPPQTAADPIAPEPIAPEPVVPEPVVPEPVVPEPVVPEPVVPEPELKPLPEVAAFETPPAGEPLPTEPEPPTSDADKPGEGLLSRMQRGLRRTGDNLFSGLGSLFLGRKEIDADLFEELESRLLMADVGVEATMQIIDNLTARVSRSELKDAGALHSALRQELLELLKPCEAPLVPGGHKPYVVLMVGVNGVGKTTTIGKMAKRFIGEGKTVMLAAGDTFRAAAVEQLQVWGERNGVPVIAQHNGADSASVLYDALQAAQARQIDVLIADTAGRLPNKDNLMEELKKVVRVLGKLDPGAPHEVMLVLDAGTGQNALSQASLFLEAVGVSGLCLTKLDGTAKGGVIFAIARKLGLPIRFIGVGEAVEDLQVFEADGFVDALFQTVDPPPP